jgi:hypothetical protein
VRELGRPPAPIVPTLVAGPCGAESRIQKVGTNNGTHALDARSKGSDTHGRSWPWRHRKSVLPSQRMAALEKPGSCRYFEELNCLLSLRFQELLTVNHARIVSYWDV